MLFQSENMDRLFSGMSGRLVGLPSGPSLPAFNCCGVHGTEWTLEIVVPPLPHKQAFLPMRLLSQHSQIHPFATVSPHASPRRRNRKQTVLLQTHEGDIDCCSLLSVSFEGLAPYTEGSELATLTFHTIDTL